MMDVLQRIQAEIASGEGKGGKNDEFAYDADLLAKLSHSRQQAGLLADYMIGDATSHFIAYRNSLKLLDTVNADIAELEKQESRLSFLAGYFRRKEFAALRAELNAQKAAVTEALNNPPLPDNNPYFENARKHMGAHTGYNTDHYPYDHIFTGITGIITAFDALEEALNDKDTLRHVNIRIAIEKVVPAIKRSGPELSNEEVLEYTKILLHNAEHGFTAYYSNDEPEEVKKSRYQRQEELQKKCGHNLPDSISSHWSRDGKIPNHSYVPMIRALVNELRLDALQRFRSGLMAEAAHDPAIANSITRIFSNIPKSMRGDGYNARTFDLGRIRDASSYYTYEKGSEFINTYQGMYKFPALCKLFADAGILSARQLRITTRDYLHKAGSFLTEGHDSNIITSMAMEMFDTGEPIESSRHFIKYMNKFGGNHQSNSHGNNSVFSYFLQNLVQLERENKLDNLKNLIPEADAKVIDLLMDRSSALNAYGAPMYMGPKYFSPPEDTLLFERLMADFKDQLPPNYYKCLSFFAERDLNQPEFVKMLTDDFEKTSNAIVATKATLNDKNTKPLMKVIAASDELFTILVTKLAVSISKNELTEAKAQKFAQLLAGHNNVSGRLAALDKLMQLNKEPELAIGATETEILLPANRSYRYAINFENFADFVNKSIFYAQGKTENKATELDFTNNNQGLMLASCWQPEAQVFLIGETHYNIGHAATELYALPAMVAKNGLTDIAIELSYQHQPEIDEYIAGKLTDEKFTGYWEFELNEVPEKKQALFEIFRFCKEGGINLHCIDTNKNAIGNARAAFMSETTDLEHASEHTKNLLFTKRNIEMAQRLENLARHNPSARIAVIVGSQHLNDAIVKGHSIQALLAKADIRTSHAELIGGQHFEHAEIIQDGLNPIISAKKSAGTDQQYSTHKETEKGFALHIPQKTFNKADIDKAAEYLTGTIPKETQVTLSR